jgi:hypothetical protein
LLQLEAAGALKLHLAKGGHHSMMRVSSWIRCRIGLHARVASIHAWKVLASILSCMLAWGIVDEHSRMVGAQHTHPQVVAVSASIMPVW